MYTGSLSIKESAEAVNEINANLIRKTKENAQKAINEANEMREERDYIIESREILRETNRNYKEFVTTKLLGDAFKAIYITALENSTDMSEADYALAEKMVDNYISENGVYAVLRKMGAKKTYLLETLKSIVEDSAEDAAEKADDEDKEVNEVPADTKEDMFNKLEKEDEVEDAVKLISDRIASAEEEFIKKNAEDKKKIEDIVAGINDRIQAVKDDLTKDDETKDKIEQECAMEKNKLINDIYESRTHTIFDHMVHETAKNVVKDATLKDVYTESGSINISDVVKSCKCMYGFLEFVNTIQLEKVDPNYVKHVVAEL